MRLTVNGRDGKTDFGDVFDYKKVVDSKVGAVRFDVSALRIGRAEITDIADNINELLIAQRM